MCRSRRELSNEYLLAKIGVDTAENEPLEVLFSIIQYYSFVSLVTTTDCCEIRRKLDLRGAMAKEMRIQDPQGMGAPFFRARRPIRSDGVFKEFSDSLRDY